MTRFITVLAALYLVALTCSMAAMETFGWLLAVSFGIYAAYRYWRYDENLYFWIGGDGFLWGFWFVVILGALTISDIPSPQKTFIIGDCRWILLLYTMAAVFVRFRGQCVRLAPYFAGVAAIVCLYGIVQAFTGIDWTHREVFEPSSLGDGQSIWRAKAFFSNSMTWASTSGMLFAFSFAGWLNSEKAPGRGRWLLGVVTTITLLSTLLTFTRGIWIALVLTIPIMIGLIWPRKFVMALLGAIFIAGSTYSFSPTVRERVNSSFSLNHKSVQDRLQLWRLNYRMFTENWVLGVGYLQNSRHLPRYYKSIYKKVGMVSHAHNNFLQVMAGVGVFGFLCYLGFAGTFLYLALRLWRNSGALSPFERTVVLGSIGAQVIFHLEGLTEANFLDSEVMHFYVVSVATVLALHHLKSKSPNNPQTASQA